MASIDLLAVHHVALRVADLAAALAFYRHLGFEPTERDAARSAAVLRNAAGVELALTADADDSNDGKNILMDASARYPGYTAVAFRVASVGEAVKQLREHRIPIAAGPLKVGARTTVAVRDPDRNVVELIEVAAE